MSSQRVRTVALAGVSAALIIIGSFIRLPLPIIPMTLQVPVILAIVLLFGAQVSVSAVSVYVALGLLGVPVFASGGGLGYVLSPSFGYLIGFIVGAGVVGIYVDRQRTEFGKLKFVHTLLGSLLFLVIVYGIGVPYLYAILNWYSQTDTSLAAVVASGFTAVVGKDLVAAVVVAGLVQRLDKVIGSGRDELHAG